MLPRALLPALHFFLAVALSLCISPLSPVAHAATCTSWTLKSDYAARPDKNPNQDACGQSGVWQYLQYAIATKTFTPLTNYSTKPFAILDPTAQGVYQWSGDEPLGSHGSPYNFPFVAINTSNVTRHPLSITVQPGEVVVHPAPDARAVIAWKSPIAGNVRISGGASSVDPTCGDGIAWFVNQNKSNVASGGYPDGTSQQFSEGNGGASLGNLPVSVGDILYFMVDPKTNYFCDSTQLDIQITQSATTATSTLAPVGPTMTPTPTVAPSPPPASPGGGTAPGTGITQLTGSVDASVGGQLSSNDGTARLLVPAGSAEHTLSVNLIAQPTGTSSAPANIAIGSIRVALTLSDTSGTQVTSFEQPLTLIMKPLDSDLASAGGDPTALEVTQLDPAGSGTFQQLPFLVNPDGTLSILLTDLGTVVISE